MRILCDDIRTKFPTLYTKDPSSENTNNYVHHTIRMEASKKKEFMAKRCALIKKGTQKRTEIFVTELLRSPRSEDKLILLACVLEGIRTTACEFEQAVRIPFSMDYYPNESM